MRIKIINIMSHPPAYGMYYKEPRPEINWDTPNGQWIGIAGYDWADLIGKEVLKLTDEFEYEVWQPDLRADKIYSHTFANNSCHKLFPAELKKKTCGLRKVEYVSSKSICENLIAESKNNKIILHLNGINSGIIRSILDLPVECPVIIQFLGEVRFPLNNLFKFQKNTFGKISNIKEHFIIKKLLGKTDAVIYCNERSWKSLKNYFGNKMFLLPVGIDFAFWKPYFSKDKLRESLNLKEDKFILLSSARLNGWKQIDEMIKILKRLDNNFDFKYIITGHGAREYERYLIHLGGTLIRKNKLKFVGYLPEQELLNFYNVADLFITASISEGMPVSAVKAMAMEIPILSTDTGLVGEFLSKYSAGITVPSKDYKVWEQKLREIFNGKKIKIVKREIVKSFFYWPNVANKYVEMYKELYDGYYRR